MAEPASPRVSLTELSSLLRDRQLSPVDVLEGCLARIEAHNRHLNAYITVFADRALDDARAAEQALARGDVRGPLQGIPVSVKDVFAAAGGPTTWGVRKLVEYRPPGDAAVVGRLRAAGAILIGKANVDTYPYDGGREGERLIGPTHNPWNLSRSAGRSSGGSGAAVAALLDYGSIGSDAAGSVRVPAAWCGVVGLKPTFGRVSRAGAFLYGDTFDHCGPIARSVSDCAVLLRAVAGYDPEDPTSVKRPVPDYTAELSGSVRGLRIGVPRQGLPARFVEPDVMRLFEDAVATYARLGADVKDVVIPAQRDARWVNVVNALETAAMAERLLPPRHPPDPFAEYMLLRREVGRERMIALGTRLSAMAQEAYAELFETVDCILTPTVPTTAPLFTDERSPWQLPEENLQELVVRYTGIVNLLRYPAISVPCGFAGNGMPAGLHVIGRPFEEAVVLRAAHAYEQVTPWHRETPRM